MYRKVIKYNNSFFVKDDIKGTHTIQMLLVDDYNLKAVDNKLLIKIKNMYSNKKWKELMKINNRYEITNYMCCDEQHTRKVFENIINYYDDSR